MPGEREDFPVARVAALARLQLSPSEETLYQDQLARILEFVGRVTAAVTDAADVEPAPAREPVAERPDEIAPSLPLDAALANAPDAADTPRLIRVPKVIG